MKKLKTKWLALTMAFVMILSIIQGGAVPMVQAAGGTDENKVEYELLDQAPMKASVRASSEVSVKDWGDGPATYAFDGNADTTWHTNYDGTKSVLPQSIEWDLGGTYLIGQLSYVRKSTAENGTWKDIVVTATLKDGTTKVVYNQAMPETAMGATTLIQFAPVEANHLKVDITSNYKGGTDTFAAAAEINVYKAIVKEPEPPVVEKPITVTPNTLTLQEGQEFELKYEVTPEAAEAGWVGSWDSANTNSGVVKFDVNTGKGVAVGTGDVTIQAKATLTTATESTTKFAGCKIHVNKAEVQSVIVLNGTEYTAESLEDAIAQFGLTNGNPKENITSIEFKSGAVRDEDLDYLVAHKKWFDFELKSFKIADDVAVYGLSGNEIPGNVFQLNGSSSTSLEHVYLGKNIKGLARGAFSKCYDLKTFEAPGLEYLKENSLARVKVEEFNFPAMKEIAENAFGTYSNSATTKISLPSVETLEHNTFKHFTNLKELTFGAVPPQIRISAKTEFEFAAGVAENLKLNIPDGALEVYKESEGYDSETKKWYGIKLPEETGTALTVRINNTEVAAESLQAAVKKAELEINDVTEIEFVSGTVTQEDLAYIETLSYLEALTMNVGDQLQLLDKAGQPTTILSPDTAQLKFAPKRSGSSSSDMETLVLGGFTEIQENGIKNPDSYMHSISMPDVVTVGESAFYDLPYLETLNLESAETIGDFAFGSCEKLDKVTMNKVQVLGEGSFQYTDNLTKLTLPDTIREIKNIQFGKVRSGNKSGTKIVIHAATPPTVESGAFSGVSSTSKYATVTVPAGAIPAYVEQISAQAKDKKVFKNKEIIWNNLYLRESGSYAIEYSVPQKSWMTQWTFVPAGEAVGERYAESLTEKIDGKVLAGWNTKQNGSGDAFTKETIPDADMKVYAQLKDLHKVIFKNGEEETVVEVVAETAIGDKLPAAPTKDGFVFTGWNTKEDGTGDVVDETYVPTANVTAYAIFKEEVNDITLGELNHKYIYIKKGETFQLNPVDVETNEPVDSTYELIGGNNYITVSEKGLISVNKKADKMNGYTQIKVKRKDDSNIYTWANVVVTKEPSVEGIDIMVPNGFTDESILNFENGGYVSGNDKNELTFNVTSMNAEWNEQKGLPIVEWYLDGKHVETKTCSYNRPNQPAAGFKIPGSIDMKNMTYGEHTVKAVVKGADELYTAETALSFNYIPVYTRYTEGRPENGSIVWKVVANDTGIVEIPEIINGQTITTLKSVYATGAPAPDGGVQEGVKELVVPDTVTEIAPKFFEAATDLKKLTIHGLNPPAVDGALGFASGAENIELVIAKEAVENYMEDAGYNADGHTWHGLALPDITAPNITATESLNDNNTVTVTLTSNEPIKTPEGWTAADEAGKVFTKVYAKNGSETVAVEDLAGNSSEVNVQVTLIDEKAPEVTVEQKYNEKDNTVTVTLTSNEPIKTPEGWTAADEEGKVFTKVYGKNGTYELVLEDVHGNVVKTKFEVDSIRKDITPDKPKPEDKPNKPSKPGKPAAPEKNGQAIVKTGDTTSMVPAAIGILAAIAAIGIVIYRKRRHHR